MMWKIWLRMLTVISLKSVSTNNLCLFRSGTVNDMEDLAKSNMIPVARKGVSVEAWIKVRPNEN